MTALPPPWLGIAVASSVRIEMVADVVCPYCYIGLMRLKRAIAASRHTATVEATYTPFILRRNLPREGVPKMEIFRQQFGSEARGERVIAQVLATAAEDGMQFNLSSQRAGNSEDAHRLLLWSGPRAMDLFEAMAETYNGMHGESLWLGDHDVLIESVRRCGLDTNSAAEVLADPAAFSEELEAGLQRASELGVTGVPAFFVNGVLLGTGALSEAALRSVIGQTCSPG